MTFSETIGAALCVAGGSITALNFYTSFLRYPLLRFFRGADGRLRHVSGLPLFGSLLLWIGAALLASYPAAMWSALVLSAFDTLGLHVFVVCLAIQAIRSR